MKKKHKIDFIINECNNYRLLFRFYPQTSSCHSFNEDPPKTWNEVYKVYYHYAIIRQQKRNPEDTWGDSEILFTETCDECSMIGEIAERCKLLSEGKTIFEGESVGEKYTINLLNNEVRPFGTGTSWIISRHYSTYTFLLFNWNNVGFRFYLKKEKLREFSEYLNACCEYMLQHGEPI